MSLQCVNNMFRQPIRFLRGVCSNIFKPLEFYYVLLFYCLLISLYCRAMYASVYTTQVPVACTSSVSWSTQWEQLPWHCHVIALLSSCCLSVQELCTQRCSRCPIYSLPTTIQLTRYGYRNTYQILFITYVGLYKGAVGHAQLCSTRYYDRLRYRNEHLRVSRLLLAQT